MPVKCARGVCEEPARLRAAEPGRTVHTPVSVSRARYAVDGIHCSAHGCDCAAAAAAEQQRGDPGGCLAWCARCTLLGKLVEPATGFDAPAWCKCPLGLGDVAGIFVGRL